MEQNNSSLYLYFTVNKIRADRIQSNPAISKSQGKLKKKFEIEGLQSNRGSVKGKGKSKGIRSSFEIARFDRTKVYSNEKINQS